LVVGETEPEKAYRSGYQHGAHQAFRAVENLLSPGDREIVRQWVEEDIYKWRLAGLRRESDRESSGLTEGAEPPTWRLGNLGRPNSN